MNRSRTVGGTILAAGLLGMALRSYLGGLHGLDPEAWLLAHVSLTALGWGLLLGGIPRGQGVTGTSRFRWRIARAAALAITAVILIMTAVVYIHDPPRADRSELISLMFVAVFSGGIGFAELTERYRDSPARLFAADPTIIYVSVNVAAAVGALALIREFGVFDLSQPHRAIYEVMLASFGSIAFFRSSLFTARVGDKDLDVGPSTLLKSLLETSDRMINRSQARDRADDAASIMQPVDFAKAKAALPAVCFTVVENITPEDQQRVAASINQLSAAGDMTDEQ